MAKLEFWFEFASTYSYLSAMRIEEIAQEKQVEVVWKPFLLGPIFGAQGWTTSPFNLYPAKGTYMWRDMARLCAARDLPLVQPDPFPQNSLLAARAAIAAQSPAFCRAVYAASFGSGLNISDPGVLAECLSQVGLARDILDQASDPAIKAALRAQTEDAQARGLFGAPSFLVGYELFWGDDRLDQAIAFAEIS